MQGSSSSVGTCTLEDRSHDNTIKTAWKLAYWILGLLFLFFSLLASVGWGEWWGAILFINGVLFLKSSLSLNGKSRAILGKETVYLIFVVFFFFLGLLIIIPKTQPVSQPGNPWGVIFFFIMTAYSYSAISLKEGSKGNPVIEFFSKKTNSLSFVNASILSDSPKQDTIYSPLQTTNFKVENELKEARIPKTDTTSSPLQTTISKFEKERESRILEAEQLKLEIKTMESSKEQLIKIDEMDGYEFEEYVKRIYEKLGYSVNHTPLSGDQGADLILSKNGKKTAVQVKRYAGKVSNKAVQEVVASKSLYKCSEGIVVTNNYFTDCAIELANANNIYLVDRDALNKMIEYAQ